jgi:virginiamycin B lyase
VVSYLPGLSSGALWVGGSGNGGELWRVPASGQNPVLYQGWYDAKITAVVEGPDTRIWAYDAYGEVLWACISSGPDTGTFNLPSPLSLPGSAGTGICVGQDKNLWVSDTANGVTGGVWKVVAPGGPATYYPLNNSQPQAIVSGPDGNLWVADSNGGVWKVSTSGVGTFIALPSAAPYGITVGPDGALWVADAAGYVWRVTTAGAFSTPILLAHGSTNPHGIASGPDKRLWVASVYSDAFQQIATLTTALVAGTPITSLSVTPTTAAVAFGDVVQVGAGSATDEFSVDTATPVGSTSIQLGSTASPYYNHPVGTIVGLPTSPSPSTGSTFAVTTAGAVAEYSLPTAPGVGSAPYAIVTGPDGRLWIADQDGYVWAMTTSGQATPYQLPNSLPTSICAGP